MRERATRRRVLEGVGIAATAGLAGCLFGRGDDGDYYDGESFVAEDDEPELGGHLQGIDHPGTVDWTGASEEKLVVAVGTGREGMGYAPRAVRIEAGSTVTWEWTGAGGRHDVVDTDGTFDSGEQYGEGETFSFTFDESGVYTYYCTPHRHRGMKGALEVIESGAGD
ncbi:halocyanin domain-containing protein [Natronosalvus rutilus]|uniref:Halocyanin domain-containing protein n=1 Tax=Natronosalvus rutilus TaxID=2953753 RepID=A0A9E7SXN7_9EURY|nr:halocyanin domain-containing protein [Natronosalvus rutilus]UTF54268.1 halocyanin domain-containing protein [Natronosalvus rutilus]